jgi:hypothetical protein
MYDCKCERVVVLAHSQGAFIAVDALRGFPPGSVDLLLTFGSGVRKLAEIKQAPEGIPAFWAVLGVSIPTTIFLSLLYVFPSETMSYWALRLLMLGAPVWFVCFLLLSASSRLAPPEFDLSLFRAWKDYFASKDPVPDGPISKDVSESVTNFSSRISDHTGYWANRDEFVSLIAHHLLDLLNLSNSWIPYYSNKHSVGAARLCRVRCRKFGLLMITVTIAAVWSFNYLCYPDVFRLTYSAVVGAIDGKAGGQGVVRALKVFFVPQEGTALHIGVLKGGPQLAFYVSVFLLLIYLVSRVVWQTWDEYAYDEVFTGQKTERCLATALYITVIVGGCLIGGLSYDGSLITHVQSGLGILGVAFSVGVVLVVAGIALLLWFGMFLLRAMRRARG